MYRLFLVSLAPFCKPFQLMRLGKSQLEVNEVSKSIRRAIRIDICKLCDVG